MFRTTKRTLAALLAAAVLALPGAALADSQPAPLPAEMPVKDGPTDPVSLAEVKVTREQAIEIVKNLFTIPAEMLEPNANLSQSKQGAAWHLEWQTPSKAAERRSISASVDAITGIILSFNRSEQNQVSGELTYSRSEGRKVAAELLTKLAGSLQDSLRYVDDPLEYGFYGGGTMHRFHWDRMEQGYPVTGDGIDMVIDARDGKLVNYNLNWGRVLTFTAPAKVLEQEKAQEAYYNQLPMQLQYQRFTRPGIDKGEWKLVYRPQTGFPMVNMDGKLIGWDGKPIDFTAISQAKLVPAAAKPYVKPAEPLSKEQALALAQTVAARQDQPTGLNCTEYGEETKTRSCQFNWSDPKNESNPNVQVDLETGVVIHFSDWGSWRKGEPTRTPKVNAEQARQIAMDFIRSYRPDLAGNVLAQVHENMAQEGLIYGYSVSFQRTYEFVPVAGYGAHMEIDPHTGRIAYFYSESMPKGEQMPSLEGVIKSTEALKSFMTHKGLELTWITTFERALLPGWKEAGMVEPGTNEPQTMLVWAPKRILPVEMLDAKTGALYDYSGRDLVEMAKRPVDIEGHAAQREIELLWARGIFELKDGKFNPDQAATAGDLAQWLVMVRGMQPYMAYDYAMGFGGERAAAAANFTASKQAPYLGAALQYGILLPEDFDADADPSEPVSRELFALWAVRALGYGEIAKMENRIAMSFGDKGDIGARYANAAALLNGLKIVRSDLFRPQANITRAEAAQILLAVASKGQVYPMWK